MPFGPIVPEVIGPSAIERPWRGNWIIIPQGTRYKFSSAIGPFTIGWSPIDIIPADYCLQGSEMRYDWMAVTHFIDGCVAECVTMPAPIIQAPNGPYASGSTPVFNGQIVDQYGFGVPAADLVSLTLTIVDTLSGEVINGVQQVNILNTGRGAVDDQGNVVITLTAADTSLSETNAVKLQRSLVIDWTGAGLVGTGRHQVNFILLALAGL